MDIQLVDIRGKAYMIRNAEIELHERSGYLVVRVDRQLHTFILRNLINYSVVASDKTRDVDKKTTETVKDRPESKFPVDRFCVDIYDPSNL